jgi:hypothetical protein
MIELSRSHDRTGFFAGHIDARCASKNFRGGGATRLS